MNERDSIPRPYLFKPLGSKSGVTTAEVTSGPVPVAPPAPADDGATGLLDRSNRLLSRESRPGRLDSAPIGLDARPGPSRMRLGPLGIIGLIGLSVPGRLQAQDSPGTIAQQVGIVQNLGAQIPLDVVLRDESGRGVRTGDLLGRRPAILAFVYYRCPMLCSKELESLTRSLRVMTLKIGEDFDILTISISPDETPSLAGAKKKAYMKALDRPGADRGWHFLTGDSESITRLAETAGFGYRLDPKTGLYAHDAGLIILTPDGRIAKYLPGLDYPAKNLQAVLKQSSRGVIGRAATWVKLLCYDYDPSTGRYSLAILRTVRAGGIITVLALAASMLLMNRRARARDRMLAVAAPSLA